VDDLIQDAVLRIGEVCGVDGRRIYVLVDRNKNLSDMFLDGDVLKNISVNSYIEIRKGFLSIIGRVEGEHVEDAAVAADDVGRQDDARSKRTLTVSLSGYIDQNSVFVGGTRELPLIGDEAYIVTRAKIHLVHNLAAPGALCVNLATIFGEDFDIAFPIDRLFNTHIAIFGNTGSGKSNTLAILYQELVKTLEKRNSKAFRANAHFALFDFNGEYAHKNCITEKKKVYHLSTRSKSGDRIPISEDDFLDLDVLSILADATEKTQKPFIRRTLGFYKHVHSADDPDQFIRNILLKRVRDALCMSDKVRAHLLLDYFEEILQLDETYQDNPDIRADLEWHNKSQEFCLKGTSTFFGSSPDSVQITALHKAIQALVPPSSLLARVILFLYSQMIGDIIANRAQNEHIAPVINRLKSKRSDIDKLFNIGGTSKFWERNFVVINLDDVNLDMKKTLPLLLSRKLYAEQKAAGDSTSLSIIIDEAHNILSTDSFREAESWKDYRLETFEEIIKEGRKFGVFVTIASQRPNDISPTITSQAHNYFIHRLINERDLQTIASAVSYIDRVTEESIPNLPTGTCVFSGVASQMPLKINIRPLAEDARPRSGTRQFSEIVPQILLGARVSL
jgi:DNA helicase HerA-like ATPase